MKPDPTPNPNPNRSNPNNLLDTIILLDTTFGLGGVLRSQRVETLSHPSSFKRLLVALA